VQFKAFSQRVEEIDIDVYRSLHAVKAEPSSGSSFFIDALVEWRVCDFSFACFVYFKFFSILKINFGSKRGA